MRSTFVLLAVLLLAGFSLLGAGENAAKPIANFSLNDNAGKPWALADLKDSKAIVVVFLGTQCPVNNAYAP